MATELVEPPPPAPPLCDEELQGLKTRLCQAVLSFQSAMHSTETGSLAQVWLPERNDDGSIVLRTKGLPFCVAGVGDLLALFRCISCRYCFGTSLDAPEILGAPGRVYTTGEPEYMRNVQQSSKEVFLRTAEASQCRVHSVLVLPLFADAGRRGSLGVLELVTTAEDMPFDSIVSTVGSILQRCLLYTCDPSVQHKEMESSLAAVKTFAKLRVSSGLRRTTHSSSDGSPSGLATPAVLHGVREEDPAEAKPPAGDEVMNARAPASALDTTLPSEAAAEADRKGFAVPAVRNAVLERVWAAAADPSILRRSSRASSVSAGSGGAFKLGSFDAGTARTSLEPGTRRASFDRGTRRTSMETGDGDMGMGDEDWDFEVDDGDAGGDAARMDDAFRRRGKGSGNSGKPGKKLRLEDLQSQFGVGLKEAASRLGICATTLKRACRRHGIQRWPRRQLVKLSKALDQHISEQNGKAEEVPGQGWIAPMPDNRWSTLAKIVPNLDDEDEQNGTGRMSMSPPSTARGSQVLMFEGAIPHEVAPEPPQHQLAGPSLGQGAVAAVHGQVPPPPLAPDTSQGMAQGVSRQPTAPYAAPASSRHSGGSNGPPDAGGSDVGSGVSNTPKAAQEFYWALGLDLLPHDEADPLFCGLQAAGGQHGAATGPVHLEHNGSLPHPHALANSLQQRQQQRRQPQQDHRNVQWRPVGDGQQYLPQPGSPLSSEPLQAQVPHAGSRGAMGDPQHGHFSFSDRGMEEAVIERKQGPDGAMSLTFTHQQRQAPHHSSSPPGKGFLADGRPALQRTSAPGPMAGPFHQAQRAQQARLQHIAQQRQTALVKQAQEQEDLQREWNRRSGTLSMVEHNMAASPGFHHHQQPQQQQPQQQQPQHQQPGRQQQQEEGEHQRAALDDSRLEMPDGVQKLSTSSLDALIATGSFTLEPYMEDEIGLVDSEVFQLMLRS